MRVEVWERLGRWAGEWDELVDGQDLPTPFLRSWWVDNAAGGRPRIIGCVEDGTLVGGAAFESDRPGRGPVAVERLRCVGQGELAPDHLDIVARPGRHAEVLARVTGWLRRPGARLVDLDGLAADGHLARALGRWVIDRDLAPAASLVDGVDGYLASRPGRLRSTIRRTRARLERSGATVRVVPDGTAGADPQEAGRVLATLAELHEGRWAGASGFLRAWPRFEAAAREALRRGEAFAVELVAADGTVVATELDLVAGSRVAFYQAGRDDGHDWRGAGSVVKAAAVAAAGARGASEYDLLRGDEPYKADWSTGARGLVRVRFGVGARGRALAAALAGWRRAAPAVHRARDAVRPRRP